MHAWQIRVLRQLLAAAFIDQVAVRKDVLDNSTSSGTQWTNSKGVPYRAMGIAEDVFIHPSSALIGKPPPEYVVYLEVVRTSWVWLKGKLVVFVSDWSVQLKYLGLTLVNPSWLSSLGGSALCTFSKPIKNEKGIMMCIPRFGPDGWELPPVKAGVQ